MLSAQRPCYSACALLDCGIASYHFGDLRSAVFSLDRIVGGRKANWVWAEDAPLRETWRKNCKVTGRTYVELRDADGGLRLRSVGFQL